MFDPSQQPLHSTVTAYLGAAAPLWVSVIGQATRRAPQLAEAWHFAGPKIGWSLRLVDGDRIVVYLTPGEGLAESQRQAYASFADDRDQTIQRAEIALLEYYTTTVDDVRLRLGESAASLAPPILAVTGLSRVLKPTHLYFPLDFPEDGRIMGVLLDATWDPGHGVGVKLINEAVGEIGTQDIIL